MPLMTPTNSQFVQLPSSSYQFVQNQSGYMMPGQLAVSNVGIGANNQNTGSGGGLMSPTSNLRSVGQFVSNGFQLPQSTFLNNIGGNFGFATQTGAPLAGGIGPTNTFTPGSLTSSSLSSTLGAAGIGMFAGNFLGRIGGNSTGGSIGGGVGAAVGNMIAPGIGGVVGGLLGGIGGGFFGGRKKPNPAGFLDNVALSPTGALGAAAKFEGKHVGEDAFNPVKQDISQYFQNQMKLYGIDALNTKINFGMGYDVNGTGIQGGSSEMNSYLSVTLPKEAGGDGIQKIFNYQQGNDESYAKARADAFNLIAKYSGKDISQMQPVTTQGSAGGISIRPRTQGSFNEFMKVYRGNANVNPAT